LFSTRQEELIMQATSLIPLRISMYPMGALISAGDGKSSAELFGRYSDEYHSYYSEFNRSYVWVQDGSMTGQRLSDGQNRTRYTGVLRDLQANYSDVLLVPMPRSPDTEIVEFGVPMDSSPVVMTSGLDIRQYSNQILTQLFRFSIDIMLLLLFTMIVFACLLKYCEREHGTVTSEFDSILHMMLNQVQVAPATSAGRVLVVMTMIGVYFWLLICQNQMKMEMVAFDTSSVVQTIEEAVEANKTLAMTRTEAAYLEVEQRAKDYPWSPLGQLHKNVMYDGTGDQQALIKILLKLMQEIPNNVVIIVSEHLKGYMEGSLCVFFCRSCMQLLDLWLSCTWRTGLLHSWRLLSTGTRCWRRG
jgi:hypothetical protein